MNPWNASLFSPGVVALLYARSMACLSSVGYECLNKLSLFFFRDLAVLNN